MTTTMDPVGDYVAQFAQRASAAGAAQPAWMRDVRRRAMDAFERLGFPTSRDEEWRFTSVAPIAGTRFVPASDDAAALSGDLDACRLPAAAAELVFVNGRYAPQLSRTGQLPAGARVESLGSVLHSPRSNELEPHLARVATFENRPFTALNTALWTDGAWLFLPAGSVVESPIHLLFVSGGDRSPRDGDKPTIAHPRVLAVMGRGTQAAIVESYAGASADRYFTNAVTEVVLGEQAIVDHYKVQRESDSSFHIATISAAAGPRATFRSHSLGFGGALVRNDVVVSLLGEGGECTLNGLYVADGTRLVDNHTTIDHAKPHCASRELYKGILAERARAVFNGKIFVRPDAQKTDAKQTNKALLLSEDAQINTKPQLEIFANDVKCTHGAAVGQMDEDALFYVRSRGLPLQEARNLLIQAFAGDVLNRIPLDILRARTEAELFSQLAKWGGRR